MSSCQLPAVEARQLQSAGIGLQSVLVVSTLMVGSGIGSFTYFRLVASRIRFSGVSVSP